MRGTGVGTHAGKHPLAGTMEHDAGYRSLFSDKGMVAHLIRGFVRESWVDQLDLDTLESVSGSFVSEDFKKRESDVIWRVSFRGQWLYVYLLIEFQSTVDRFMALRLMVYVGLLYQRLIDEQQIGPNSLLPPVLPIVLYNGEQRWSAPRELGDLMVECPPELAAYRPKMRYFLLEEQAVDDAELAGMEKLAALVFRFEQCRTPSDFGRVIDAMVRWAWQPEHRLSVKRLERWARTLLWQGRLPEEPEPDWDDIEECGAMLKERVKQWEKELIEKGIAEGMERGIQQGIEQGIEQGIQRGIERGIEQGEAEILIRQLRNKFGLIPDEFRKRIDEADSKQLLIWAERILTAERWEDVFDG